MQTTHQLTASKQPGSARQRGGLVGYGWLLVCLFWVAQLPRAAGQTLLVKASYQYSLARLDTAALFAMPLAAPLLTGAPARTFPALAGSPKARTTQPTEQTSHIPNRRDQPTRPLVRQAIQSLEPFPIDSLNALMTNTLADYLGAASNTPAAALQRLRADLVANRADRGFLYYAIAFIHERSNGATDWSTAEKWYTYAFQLHYTPAYQRLKRYYGQEIVAPVKLTRLEKNWQNGITEIPLTLKTPAGAAKTVSVYVMDSMGNTPDPIAGEVARLLDLFGVVMPLPTVERFNSLYREARQNNRSYQLLCQQHFLGKP